MSERVTIDGKEWTVLSEGYPNEWWRRLAHLEDGGLTIRFQWLGSNSNTWIFMEPARDEDLGLALSASETQALTRLLARSTALKKIAAIYNKWAAHDNASSYELVEIGDVLQECGLRMEPTENG